MKEDNSFDPWFAWLMIGATVVVGCGILWLLAKGVQAALDTQGK